MDREAAPLLYYCMYEARKKTLLACFHMPSFVQYVANCCFSDVIFHPLEQIKIRQQLVDYPAENVHGKVYRGAAMSILSQCYDEGIVQGVYGGLMYRVANTVSTKVSNVFLRMITDSLRVNDQTYSHLFSIVCISSLSIALQTALTHTFVYYRTVQGVPSAAVSPPMNLSDQFSGYGLSVLGHILYKGIVAASYNWTSSLHTVSMLGKFIIQCTTSCLGSFIIYPLDTIRRTQMVRCCNVSEAITTINESERGYFGGAKHHALKVLGLAVMMGLTLFRSPPSKPKEEECVVVCITGKRVNYSAYPPCTEYEVHFAESNVPDEWVNSSIMVREFPDKVDAYERALVMLAQANVVPDKGEATGKKKEAVTNERERRAPPLLRQESLD